MLACSIFSSQQQKSRKVYILYCIRDSRFSESPSQFDQSIKKYADPTLGPDQSRDRASINESRRRSGPSTD